MDIRFTLDLEPIPKARPRLARNGHCYTPEKTASFERSVRRLSDEWVPATGPYEGPVYLQVVFHLRRPKSVRRPHPACRPDLDNYIKAVMDGLCDFWKDDAQVVSVYARKVYTDRPKGYIQIGITEVD